MKKILSLILALCMVFSAFSINVLAATRDPYNDILFTSYDEVNGDVTKNTNSNKMLDYIGGLNSGEYVVFKNVDFGTHNPRKLYINAFGNNNPTMEIVLQREGSSDISLGNVTVNGTGSWGNNTEAITEVGINNAAISGVYDLVFKFSGGINLRYFSFAWSYENITAPEITLDTTDFANAQKIAASAAVDRAIDEEPTPAALLLAEYDENGTMLKIRSDEETITEGVLASFSISLEDKDSDTKFAIASLVDKDMNIIAPGKMVNVPTQSGTASSKGIDIITSNSTITVSGSGVTDERVMIVVVPSTYDTAQPLYKTAVQLYEKEIVDGQYYYQFKMDNDLPSDTYKVLIIGGNTNLSATFDFTSPSLHKNILKSLRDATDSDAAMSVLETNAAAFGIETVMVQNLDSFDKNLIKSMAEDYFVQNPIEENADDYSSWLSGISEKILSQCILGYIKANDKVNGYIEKYAAKLGVSGISEYTEYYANNKNYIDSALVELIPDEQTETGFAELFKDATTVGMFNSSTSWGYIDDYLMEFAAILGIDVSLYSRLPNNIKQEICSNFVGVNYSDKTAIQGLFNTLISGYGSDDIVDDNYEREKILLGQSIFSIDLPRTPEEMAEEIQLKAFEDLDSVPWAKDSINSMRSAGIINGKSETIFAPNDSVTREEFATMLVRAMRIRILEADAKGFNDVNVNAWYAPYVATAKETGIVNGVTDEWFGIGEAITREQAAAMIYRSAGICGKIIIPHKTTVAYTDSSAISQYAYEAIQVLSKAEILNGMGNDRFAPKNNMTRAEAAVLLARFLANVK